MMKPDSGSIFRCRQRFGVNHSQLRSVAVDGLLGVKSGLRPDDHHFRGFD